MRRGLYGAFVQRTYSINCVQSMLSNHKDKKRKHEDEKCDGAAEDEGEGDGGEGASGVAEQASKKNKKNKKRKSKASSSTTAPVKSEAEKGWTLFVIKLSDVFLPDDRRIPVTVLTGFLGSGKVLSPSPVPRSLSHDRRQRC